MKKFIVTILCYAVLVLGITFGVNALYICLTDVEETDEAKFQAIPTGIEICNFGSSHGLYGYDYSDVDKVCFNFGLESQSLSYDLRLMEYYKDNLADDCIVFINVSYFSMYNIPETAQGNFTAKNARYYSFLPAEYIKEYDANTDKWEAVAAVLPAVTENMDFVRDMLSVLTSGPDLPGDDPIKTAENRDNVAAAEAAVGRHLVAPGLFDEAGNLMVNQDELDCLIAMLDMCEEEGWRPILITTPYMTEYTEAVIANDAEFLGEFEALVTEIAGENDVPYYDYGNDQRFANDASLFIDVDHLNSIGAKMFTEILLKETI